VNIDECIEVAEACDPNATCTDTPGSYTCACNDGYVGDGFECRPERFAFSISQTINGREVRCASVVNNGTYTQCTNLTVGGQYFPNGIECGPRWGFESSRYSDTYGFCESLTGSRRAESYWRCDSTRPRITWSSPGVWGTTNDNGYTESLRCYY
jgi:hypothetical protein